MVDKIDTWIQEVEAGRYILPDDLAADIPVDFWQADSPGIPSLSSRKVRELLNRLCSPSGTHYLEVGVHLGGTFVSAIYNNPSLHAIAIDNWGQYGNLREKFEDNLARHRLPTQEITVIEQDCFAVSLSNLPQIEVYLYDALHTREAQYQAISYYDPILADRFVLVVDDFNCVEVQEETYRALRDLQYRMIREWVLPARFIRDTEQWWDGLFVAVIQKG